MRLVFGVIVAVSLALAGSGAAAKPNILLIVADDLGISDIGAFGGEISTPHLDALAGASVLLTNFYAAPTCSPTRAMLMSGSDSHLVGLGKMAESRAMPQQVGRLGYEGYLTGQVATMPELLRDAGYATLMAGKWHLGREIDQSPNARGFDRSFALTTGYANHFGERSAIPLGILDATPPGAEYREDGHAVLSLPHGFFSSDFYAERLIEYLEENRTAGKSFFAYLAFTAPHWPLQAPAPYVDKYNGRYDSGYDVLRRARFERLKALGLVRADVALPPTDPDVPPWDSLAPAERVRQTRMMQVYAGMVDNMDANIGRVIGYLKRTGAYDQTIIVFMSDNGADATPEMGSWLASTIAMHDNSLAGIGTRRSFVVYGPGWAAASGAHLRASKGSTFDGGIRVPAMIRLPADRGSGRRFDGALYAADWLPTLLELAGAAPPRATYRGRAVAPVRGRSFARALDDARDGAPRSIAMELDDDRVLRQGDWKAVYVTEGYSKELGIPAGWRLYNVARDPGERDDQSEREPARLAGMIAAWDRYAAESGVAVPNQSALH